MKRVIPLDGVRGVAIVLVLIWHYCASEISPDSNRLRYLPQLTSLTWSGVDLFFVLSGFLIAGILLDHRNSPNLFRAFYIRRVCRILPLYFLVLGSYVILSTTRLAASESFSWLLAHPFPIWSYATFTQNIFMGNRGDFGPNWLGVTWSLAVEEQFYLFVPLLIYFLPRRAALIVFLIAVLAAPVFRSTVADFVAFVNMPMRADSLLSGAALAVLVRSPAFMTAVRKNRGLLYVLLVVLLVIAIAMSSGSRYGLFDQFRLAGFYACLILMAFADSAGILARSLNFRPLVWLGNLSYGIYMFHQPVNGLLFGFLRRGSPKILTVSDVGITLLSLAITLLLAALSFQFFERPIQKLGHKVRYQDEIPRDATAPQAHPTPISN